MIVIAVLLLCPFSTSFRASLLHIAIAGPDCLFILFFSFLFCLCAIYTIPGTGVVWLYRISPYLGPGQGSVNLLGFFDWAFSHLLFFIQIFFLKKITHLFSSSSMYEYTRLATLIMSTMNTPQSN